MVVVRTSRKCFASTLAVTPLVRPTILPILAPRRTVVAVDGGVTLAAKGVALETIRTNTGPVALAAAPQAGGLAVDDFTPRFVDETPAAGAFAAIGGVDCI